MLKQIIGDVVADLSKRSLGDASVTKQQLNHIIRRLGGVSREEFDTQAAVLQRTRARLEALEQALAELEATVQK
ncbi:MAG: accessory factor UbiK family protein [Cellvibrionaceae bacterium]|nr:accessory factor UbiK family protein [Cellvibrionaceae bacterium]